MANSYEELIGMISKLILDVTKYYVPRIGKVSKIVDDMGKGRILVHIPMLGWDTDNIGAWCYPKDKNSLLTPGINDYVLVEFIDGDRDLPVYSGLATQMKDMLPRNYENQDTQIIFESRGKDDHIQYNEKEKKLSIESGEITFNGDDKVFVTHAALDSALQTFITALNTHVHAGNGIPPTVPMNINISAAATTTIKTGG